MVLTWDKGAQLSDCMCQLHLPAESRCMSVIMFPGHGLGLYLAWAMCHAGDCQACQSAVPCSCCSLPA